MENKTLQELSYQLLLIEDNDDDANLIIKALTKIEDSNFNIEWHNSLAAGKKSGKIRLLKAPWKSLVKEKKISKRTLRYRLIDCTHHWILIRSILITLKILDSLENIHM